MSAACPPNGCWGTFVTCDAHLAVTLPAGPERRPGGRGDHRARHRLVRPARPGQDRRRRQGVDPLRDRRRGTGGDRDRPRRGSRDLRHRGQPGAASTVARHGHRARLRLAQHRVRRPDPPRHRRLRRRHRAQLRCPAPRSAPGWNCCPSADDSSRSANATSTATPGWGCSRSAATSSFYGVDLALMSVSSPGQGSGPAEHGVPTRPRTVYCRLPETTHYPLADAATAIRVMGAAEHTGKLVLDVPARRAQQRGGAAGAGSGLPPRRRLHHHRRPRRPRAVPRREDGRGGLRPDRAHLPLPADPQGAGGHRAHPRDRAPTSRWSAATSPNPERRARWWRWRPPPGFRCAACCTRRRWSRTPRWPTSPTSSSTATGRRRSTAHGTCTTPRPRSRWTGSARSPRRPRWWARPGQGAYAAANSWLDAFTHWRRAQGLPADRDRVGSVGRDRPRRRPLAEGDATALSAPDEGAYAFETLLRHDRAYTGYAPMMGTPWLTAFAQRSPFAEMFKSAGQSCNGRKRIPCRAERAAARRSGPPGLRRLVSEQVSLILRRTIDPDRPLSEYGLDSLGNLELRTRIETETGIRITSTDITTVRGLADHLYDKLAPAEDAASATT